MQNNEVLKPAKYFSELEKSVLLALVEKYKYVLECKKSDARTIALKQRTWQALAHEYNSQPSVSLRDFKQLKKCWENIKARTKKIMAHERREKIKRFGPLCSIESLKDKVASMIPEQLYFVQNHTDESGYNHDTSNQDIDCKRVNLLDLELLIDEQGKIQTKAIRKAPETNSLCVESSPSRPIDKASYHKQDLELLIDEQGKIQTEPIRKMPVTESLCSEGSPSNNIKKEPFAPDRDMYSDEKSIVSMHECEGTSLSGPSISGPGPSIPSPALSGPGHSIPSPGHSIPNSAMSGPGPSHSAPSCSSTRLPGNRTYRSRLSQNGLLLKMHEEEHHQQMSILQLQLIQMNEVHVSKVQQIERECELAEEEHRVKMEILNKKKMYWERKLQTITKEWPVASFNRPFPNSP
ncbi:myb/SANT-like DNA-binding domain-containing protein 3 isoform 1-T1 [Discoglossus pictus]